ncbi:hypothetical protein I6E61_03005 [Psychrobacter sp. NZS113]|uniref:hypothetical protein n=1 Tax=Psychrobacter sp. NZS113 TaxID=2792045 RepID=UPI0018CEEBF6|nr:hypothetical protein [Psychrobacter sp. NZS113]MBH0095350.1 hypothetical protein [Psychrobacter sp. NZS113]
MKNINLKNIAISSLLALSSCFAVIGTANAASQPDTHHLTQKQKDAIAAKEKAKTSAAVKAKQNTKKAVVVKAQPTAKKVVVIKEEPTTKKVVVNR